MRTIRLGKTNLIVNQTGFGCLPIQRICEKQSTHLLTKAYEYGINYFDTARSYTDSEQKIAAAFSTKRDSVIIASKTMALTADAFWKDLTSSLLALQTDYIDIYQFHNPPFCPKPGSINGLYEAMLEAKAKGLILHIGISSHRRDIAEEAVKSGLYSTLQYPMSYLSSENELELIDLCQEHDVGFICMKALAGGLLARSDIAYAYLSQYPILPLWGILEWMRQPQTLWQRL